MGRLSYGIYLLHLFCLSLTLRILAKFPSFHYAIVVISMTTAFAVLTAWAMQVCIENPFLKLRRLIGRNAKMRYALASIQVGLIPTGILLAVIQRHGR
jgi:peptidoglycan/LPS O-acetylase OafA/YrhL